MENRDEPQNYSHYPRIIYQKMYEQPFSKGYQIFEVCSDLLVFHFKCSQMIYCCMASSDILGHYVHRKRITFVPSLLLFIQSFVIVSKESISGTAWPEPPRDWTRTRRRETGARKSHVTPVKSRDPVCVFRLPSTTIASLLLFFSLASL